MQIGVISDIHGNGVGFATVLDELGRHPVDRVVCLGDALQGGSQPLLVIELLQELGCPVVMGNADSWLLTSESPEQVSDAQHEVRAWTLDQIGDEGRRYIESFVPMLEVELGAAGAFLCFHGSPRSFDEILAPDITGEEFREALGPHEHRLLSGGHIHKQWSRLIDGRMFFNPGSVGLAYNRLLPRDEFYLYPVAEYAVVSVDDKDVSVDFRTLQLDPDELAKADLASGRPYADRDATRYRPPV
jgi:predicted phosphodiesterase